MDEAMVCDRLILLHKGAVLREGAPGALLASYPLALFRITGSSGSVIVTENAPLPPGTLLLYPVAGGLHAAGPKNAAAPEEILSHVKNFAPAADAIAAAEPTIEDLFFYLLSGKEAA
jgi:ABC-type multidrug transport system ATPase subunit